MYVSITVLFSQKVHDELSAIIYLLNSSTRVGFERCSRLIKKTLENTLEIQFL